MTFDEICKDFDRRRPRCEAVGRRHWFTANWDNGNNCINDLLIRWLKEWNLPCLRFNLGEQIWFLYEGQWTRTEAEPHDGVVDFYLLEHLM